MNYSNYLLSQTYFASKGEKPAVGKFLSFDHVTFYVGNAKQVSLFLVILINYIFIFKNKMRSKQFLKTLVRQNSCTKLLHLCIFWATVIPVGKNM